ncbi:MAG: hypothetical protein U0930_04685 [Pirellulales bacterium]
MKRRIGERVQNGVLADDAETRLLNPDAKSAKPVRLQTGTGVVVLSSVQADLLRHCSELVDGINSGMLPISLYQMISRQKPAQKVPADMGKQVALAVEHNQLIQDYIAQTAEVLGIDLDDYPTLRKMIQQTSMMSGDAQRGILDTFRQANEQAWSHLKNCLPASEQELLESIGKARQLRRLASLEITPEEYSDLSAELPDYRLEDVLNAVASSRVIVDTGFKAAAKEFDSERSRLLAFYDVARKRARQMANRTLEFAREDGGQALLVCLGFHQPAVLAAWRAAEASHLVVMPDLTAQ